MSRTNRCIPICCQFRRPKTHSIRKQELAAAEALIDEGARPSNRLKVRSSPKSSEDVLPSSWDDLSIAGLREAKYKLRQA